MKPKLMIVRGLPGSGKSTFARAVAEKFGIDHFENDAYLMVNGVYCWSREAVKQAEKDCFNDTMDALYDGRNAIVSNVFVTRKSIDRYVRAAKHAGAQVKVVRMTRNFGNVHNVPKSVLASMAQCFEDYPGETLK